jgi:predicted Zn-dependent protease with MMP-like domain
LDRKSFGKQIEHLLANLPADYADRLQNLVFLVEEWADAETLALVGFEASEELLGYFDGIPLTERSFDMVQTGPARIILYRGAIIEEARVSGLPIRRVIRETLWHEIAHYFGFTEEDMDRIEEIWAGSD